MSRLSLSHSRSTNGAARRASAYVFVLGITLIVTVLGMGALTLTRVTARTLSESNDWETAGTLAFSATEHAVSYLNAAAAASPAGWRSAFTSSQTAFSQTVGRGKFSWAIKDQLDGNLSADYLRSFRVYGIGTVGGVTRVYSVQVVPAGGPQGVLRTAIHSTVSISLTGNGQAINGPVSSNGSVKLSGTYNGGIEAASTTGSASGTQTIAAPSPAKSMPAATIFTDLAAIGTTIDYTAAGGTIDNCLLSPTSNPFGTASANGVYVITVPSTKKLTIQNCRIVGTLVVLGAANAVDINGPVLWEMGPVRAPILLVSAAGGTVTISGCNTWLTESGAGVNLNPPATPFGTNSDSDLLDDFPPQYRGIIHVVAGSSGQVQLDKNAYVVGSVIADCPVKTKDQTTVVQNPDYVANPPLGYATGTNLTEMPGTWRWDTLP